MMEYFVSQPETDQLTAPFPLTAVEQVIIYDGGIKTGSSTFGRSFFTVH